MPPKRRQSTTAAGSREKLQKVLTASEINAIKNSGTLNKIEQALRNESADELKIQKQKLESDLDESRLDILIYFFFWTLCSSLNDASGRFYLIYSF